MIGQGDGGSRGQVGERETEGSQGGEQRGDEGAKGGEGTRGRRWSIRINYRNAADLLHNFHADSPLP